MSEWSTVDDLFSQVSFKGRALSAYEDRVIAKQREVEAEAEEVQERFYKALRNVLGLTPQELEELDFEVDMENKDLGIPHVRVTVDGVALKALYKRSSTRVDTSSGSVETYEFVMRVRQAGSWHEFETLADLGARIKAGNVQ